MANSILRRRSLALFVAALFLSLNAPCLEADETSRQELLKKIENSRNGPTERIVPTDEQGIYSDPDIAAFRGILINGWDGYVDGKFYDVQAGYAFKNPAVGIIVVSEGSKTGQRAFYATPTATGPAYISVASGGVLTIKTKAGQFYTQHDDAEDAAKHLDTFTPGGGVYHFDLRAEAFK